MNSVSAWFNSYQLCPVCHYALVNQFNLEILQFRLRSILLVVGGPLVLTGAYFAFNGLFMLGFTSGGISAGSFAAAWQASMGYVVRGSLFAILQSLGTSFMFKLLFSTLTGTTLTYLLSTIRLHARNLYFCDCPIDDDGEASE
ncbi:uncharacterized protein LOC100162606 [Acyrthosiphon pisum]|uniref:Uncharacterized protein n=1 Tax=Acyrthosiphon pisum TaxID=7029 RepID=A0A8R1W3D6_ACYPI|nr:uncharacterized protein LOC100162606 [Acyrthosiphon pisum]|eukprot:XP_001951707.1 PREDICTED: uncharacterized protein LOC100162606 [Acyrthosiphon pisum]